MLLVVPVEPAWTDWFPNEIETVGEDESEDCGRLGRDP